MRYLRKLYRVYYDFPMNWQPWGWQHGEMSRAYWTGVKITGKMPKKEVVR